MKYVLLLLMFWCSASVAQSQTAVGSLYPKSNDDNISIQQLNADSNVTSFVIWIRKEVKPHLHATHSEHVYVLEGTGKMMLGEKMLEIKAGDLIFIPENTVHAVKVTSAIPLKVLSIQSPGFDGKDRIPVDVQW